MKSPAPFDSTKDFDHFKNGMRKLLAVSKTDLDKLVQGAKNVSPRHDNPRSPGQKRIKRPKQ